MKIVGGIGNLQNSLTKMRNKSRNARNGEMEWQSAPDSENHVQRIIADREKKIACNIVDRIFDQILLCIKADKSNMKLNMLEKSIIQGMLSDKVKTGIKTYIMNMYDEDIKLLIDDIQREINNR